MKSIFQITDKEENVLQEDTYFNEEDNKEENTERDNALLNLHNSLKEELLKRNEIKVKNS
mgnify:CR=1 FL=1